MNNRLDIIITGVGGQGTVLASRILAQAAINSGLTAQTAETIGMAQREGSVQSHVRIGAGEYGPLIGKNRADILVGFEPAEAQRACSILKPSGVMLVNIEPVIPVTVALNQANYLLDEIQKYLCGLPVKSTFVNATRLAIAAGNFRTVNTVMVGILCSTGLLPMTTDMVRDTLLDLVPAKAREVNQRAFELGLKVYESK